MKYLKSLKLFLEEFEISDTDYPDVAAKKKDLNVLLSHISGYSSGVSKIDDILLNKSQGKTSEEVTKMLDVVIEKGGNRNTSIRLWATIAASNNLADRGHDKAVGGALLGIHGCAACVGTTSRAEQSAVVLDRSFRSGWPVSGPLGNFSTLFGELPRNYGQTPKQWGGQWAKLAQLQTQRPTSLLHCANWRRLTISTQEAPTSCDHLLCWPTCFQIPIHNRNPDHPLDCTSAPV